MQGARDYYVYALLDPRFNPAIPFYIGKGQGARSYDHLQRLDNTKKGNRIRDILADGVEPYVITLIGDLSEDEALKNEALLIAAYGLLSNGGALTNSVSPLGTARRNWEHVAIPFSSPSMTSSGLELMKSAILQLLKANPSGLTNADVAAVLGLRSHSQGNQKDYLSYSLLGLLIQDGVVVKVGKLYFWPRSS